MTIFFEPSIILKRKTTNDKNPFIFSKKISDYKSFQKPEITYNSSMFKFDAVLIPHSHIDLGWKKTYENYYKEGIFLHKFKRSEIYLKQ